MKLFIRIHLIIGAALLLTVSISGAAGPLISTIGNVHNLSSANTGVTYYADPTGTDPRRNQICIFCHTPHNAQPQTPLWSRKETTKFFAVYSSATLRISRAGNINLSYPGNPTRQPDGSSKLCLSCHDGVTALGAILPNTNSPIAMYLGRNTMAAKDLTAHHPVSFVYDNNVFAYLDPAKYVLPASITWNASPPDQVVRLDRRNKMQCTTCHNPHQNQTDVGGPGALTPFWVMSPAKAAPKTPYDAVCMTCHVNAIPIGSTGFH